MGINRVMAYLVEIEGGVEIRVKAVPGASRDRVAGVLGDALKVQVSAAPEKGKANQAIIRVLSEALGVAARQITLISGGTQARKRFRIGSLSGAAARARLEARWR